jgi:hypothetical protein
MTDTITMEDKHSTRGASAASRWMMCSASPLLIEKRRREMTERERGRFDSKTSKYAEEGSAAHALAEVALKARVAAIEDGATPSSLKLDPRSVSMVGTVIMRDENGDYKISGKNPFDPNTYSLKPTRGSDTRFTFVCNQEMHDGVMLYVDTIESIMEGSVGPTTVTVESRTYPFGPELSNVFGTADCIVSTKEEVWAIDFKFGRREVSAVENTQALFYAAGALLEAGGGPDTRVNLVIIQPRVEFADGRSISDWGLTGAELIEWRDEVLKPAIDLTFDPLNVRYRIGDYCGFCPVSASCPLVQQKNLQAVKDAASEDVMSLSYVDAGKVELILPTETDAQGISAALKITSVLDLWSKRIKELSQEIALSGTTIPGFKLVRGRSQRKWKNEEDVIAAIKLQDHEEPHKNPPMLQEAYVPKKLKSPAQMEKIGLDLSAVDELSHKPQGRLSVAHETDRRPAAISDLDWLTEPE